MNEAISIALEFIESRTIREHLWNVFEGKKGVHALHCKLCDIICHARASLEDKAAALEKITPLLHVEHDYEYRSTRALASVARQALAETMNTPPGSVFQLTRYNRSKVWDDYGGKDDYWMYEFDYEAIYESSEVCATFNQALKTILEDYVDEDEDAKYVPDPAQDYTQFWNEITRYDRSINGDLHAAITWTVGESGTIWDCQPLYSGCSEYEGMPFFINRKDELWFSWCQISLYNQFHTLTPFAPGDIVTVDCRPFYPVFHAVVLSNAWPMDCCSMQIAFVNSKRRISHGALTHLNSLLPHNFVYSPFFSAFYRLDYFNGNLPNGEACVGELSAAIKNNPKWSEKTITRHGYRCTFLEYCFDAANERNRKMHGIEWKRLKSLLETGDMIKATHSKF